MSSCFNWQPYLRYHYWQIRWDFPWVNSPGQLMKQGGFLDQLFYLLLVCANIYSWDAALNVLITLKEGASFLLAIFSDLAFLCNFEGCVFTWLFDRESYSVEWCCSDDYIIWIVALWSLFKLCFSFKSNSEATSKNYDDRKEQSESELPRVSIGSCA